MSRGTFDAHRALEERAAQEDMRKVRWHREQSKWHAEQARKIVASFPLPGGFARRSPTQPRGELPHTLKGFQKCN